MKNVVSKGRRVGSGVWPGMLFLLASSGAWASSDVSGRVVEHRSPDGVVERCVALTPMPGGDYTEVDRAAERELCEIDFYAGRYAICPKVFSTSPATLVYELSGPHADGDPQRFEAAHCGEGGIVHDGVSGAPVSFKMSVNGRTTSATFANSSLAYYHFARFFGATAHVPPAVFRSMSRDQHRRRISERGVALSAHRAALKMNNNAWQLLTEAEREPSSYATRAELFTADGQVYGVMLRPTGKRYNEAVNGTRASGWGDGQNRDFQETAPFLALRSEQPLEAAISHGLNAAFKDPVLAKATRGDDSPLQIAFWMSDLIDVTLLDFIFSQQDRVGNIDYLPYWYWVEEGEVRHVRASGTDAPAEAAGFSARLLKRTELADNDAGVRVSYANYTKRTQMLEKLRHYRASVYERLMRLHRDFAAQGPLFEYVRTTFGLSERELKQVVTNTALAAGILNSSCKAGRLRFDVEPLELMLDGKVNPRQVECGSI